ncbi:SirB2 family protein [Marinobacter nanhaiticus D15-8W]|uniref:Invasion protein n=1 Tax=Marinobacter nanhaiticus D15-8W TaxID=626887 RepID=N6X5K1_9GAMM|nr:SirB2 family protein [Marinobacter nanhaiticus]ENO16388.1 invasion protein [Marinobacter nanhaiticus D15-8W]BES72751.1 SirB2 family protein [Marinobacter nanhaiticus D15-8W]
MQWYPLLKHIHITTAGLTAVLFILRLALDAGGRPGWRSTPLKWLPHLNDTLLLAAAIGLLVVTGWMPFVHHWLTGKVILLLGYIVAGRYAIKPRYGRSTRITAATLALFQLALIFWLALNKPMF